MPFWTFALVWSVGHAPITLILLRCRCLIEHCLFGPKFLSACFVPLLSIYTLLLTCFHYFVELATALAQHQTRLIIHSIHFASRACTVVTSLFRPVLVGYACIKQVHNCPNTAVHCDHCYFSVYKGTTEINLHLYPETDC